jgi:transcriptional regulator with XRE-family HTH domain
MMANALPQPGLFRDRRLECGLTQAELADRAGVSRQLVAAVEAGQNSPSVDAALRLAGALGTSVEELFASTAPTVSHALGGRIRAGAPLRVGRVGDRLVAAELADHGTAGATWARADARLEAGRLRFLAGGSPAGLVVAGCDPALGIAESILHGAGPRSLLAISAASGRALRSLAHSRLHAAVVHAPEGGFPQPPVAVLRLHLARWQVGIGTAPGLKRRSLEGLLAGNTSVVQRDPDAGSQQAFERAADRVGFRTQIAGPRAAGHIEAARTAATLDCAAVTTEAAARAFGLGFLPLEHHAVEIWFDARWRGHPALEALGDLLTRAAFTERVAQFSGYDLAGCGARVG